MPSNPTPEDVATADAWEPLETCPTCQKPTRVKAVGGTLDGQTFKRIASRDGCPTCGPRGDTHGQ